MKNISRNWYCYHNGSDFSKVIAYLNNDTTKQHTAYSGSKSGYYYGVYQGEPFRRKNATDFIRWGCKLHFVSEFNEPSDKGLYYGTPTSESYGRGKSSVTLDFLEENDWWVDLNRSTRTTVNIILNYINNDPNASGSKFKGKSADMCYGFSGTERHCYLRSTWEDDSSIEVSPSAIMAVLGGESKKVESKGHLSHIDEELLKQQNEKIHSLTKELKMAKETLAYEMLTNQIRDKAYKEISEVKETEDDRLMVLPEQTPILIGKRKHRKS